MTIDDILSLGLAERKRYHQILASYDRARIQREVGLVLANMAEVDAAATAVLTSIEREQPGYTEIDAASAQGELRNRSTDN